MLRVNSSNVLVVPPFECAWLSDETRQLKDNSGCICFEAKGENDATLIIKPKPGSKRWQHVELDRASSAQHYTIVFGSHQNSCLKIEKNSQECFRVDGVASISGSHFIMCWVNYSRGIISLGTGKPGSSPSYSWTDAEPISGVQHVGLGTWDKHVCYRNIQMQPPLEHPTLPVPDAGQDRAAVKLLDMCDPNKERPCTHLQADEAGGLHSDVPSLESLCKTAVVRGMDSWSVCGALALVDMVAPGLDEIAPALVGFLARNLRQALAVAPDSFQALPAALLAELLGNPCLECSERFVFDAVMQWAYNSQDPREPLAQSVADVENLLLLIRFPLMSQTDLEELRSHDFAQRSPLLTELLSAAAQARMHHTETDEPRAGLAVEGKRNVKALEPATHGSTSRFLRRHAPASHNLMFVSNGDSNGVSHWLGTCYGTQAWVNPVLAGRMQVQASSPSCKHTDPKAVVSGNFLRLNLAGPSKTGTWWQINLGPGHRLICNYYTLRHDGSSEFPRCWALQGSTDGVGWVDLRRHKGDCSISTPGCCSSWPVSGHAASMPYGMFRILLQGANAGASGSRDKLHLSFFELYGHFFHVRAD